MLLLLWLLFLYLVLTTNHFRPLLLHVEMHPLYRLLHGTALSPRPLLLPTQLEGLRNATIVSTTANNSNNKKCFEIAESCHCYLCATDAHKHRQFKYRRKALAFSLPPITVIQPISIIYYNHFFFFLLTSLFVAPITDFYLSYDVIREQKKKKKKKKYSS